MESRIRIANPTDGEAISAASQLLHDFNREFNAPTPGPAIIANRLVTQLGKSLFVVLACDPNVGIAVVSLRPNLWFDGPVAMLDELYVTPQHRNQGIGGQLLTAARAEAVHRGAQYMEINVDESDRDAQRFYERNGFTEIDNDSGERAFYFAGPTSWPSAK